MRPTRVGDSRRTRSKRGSIEGTERPACYVASEIEEVARLNTRLQDRIEQKNQEREVLIEAFGQAAEATIGSDASSGAMSGIVL